jgi:hypothetical protein
MLFLLPGSAFARPASLYSHYDSYERGHQQLSGYAATQLYGLKRQKL